MSISSCLVPERLPFGAATLLGWLFSFAAASAANRYPSCRVKAEDMTRLRCAILQHAQGASIGSLYQFFPNKEVVARTIKTQYCQELKELWANLVPVSAKTPTSRLIDQFLNVTIKAIAQHPAIIRLMDAPRSANPAADIKQSLREQLVELFLTRKPRMSHNKAHRYAEITVQMIRTMLWLYLENERSEREALVSEMKSAVVNYLAPRLT